MPAYRADFEALETAFLDLIKEVPGLSVGRLMSSAQNAVLRRDTMIDQVDQIYGFEAPLTTASGRSWEVIVQTRASGEPRLIRESCARLVDLIKRSPKRDRLYPVVGATYISERSAQICKEMNVGYLDLSGNCRLAFDSIFIERKVAENKNIEKRPLRSVFSPKSSRVVRLLLESPNKGWQVHHIAKDAKVSIGLASKVKQKLLDLDFATIDGDGLKAKDPEALLLAWSHEYSYKDNEIFECYSLQGMNENEASLDTYCQQHALKWALTLFSGVNRVAPFVRGLSQSAMYVQADLKKVVADLGWKPVPSGSNILLLKPFDDFILDNTQTGGLLYPIVSDIQLYLDLASHRGRGSDAAEFLLEQRIRPKWTVGRSETA
jgi:hypothetical protein